MVEFSSGVRGMCLNLEAGKSFLLLSYAGPNSCPSRFLDNVGITIFGNDRLMLVSRPWVRPLSFERS